MWSSYHHDCSVAVLLLEIALKFKTRPAFISLWWTPQLNTDQHFRTYLWTGRSKGFAHVDFANDEHAAEAVVELRDIELMGRILRVDHAAKKTDSMNRNAAPPVSMVIVTLIWCKLRALDLTSIRKHNVLVIFHYVLSKNHQSDVLSARAPSTLFSSAICLGMSLLN